MQKPSRASGLSSSPRPQVKVAIISVLLAFLALAAAYSFLFALGEGNDEVSHFRYVRYVVEHGKVPLTPEERRQVGPEGGQPPLYYLIAAVATGWVDVREVPMLKVMDPQEYPRHLLASDVWERKAILHTEDELFPYRGIALAWHLTRLLSVAMGAVTVWATYRIVREIFPENDALAVGAAAINAFIPQFVFQSAVVSNDALIFPLAALTLLMLVRLILRGFSLREGMLLVLFVALAVATKRNGILLVFESLVVAAALAAARTTRARGRLPLATLLPLAAVAAASFFIWPVWQLIDEGFRALLSSPWSRAGDPVGTLFRSFWALFGGMAIPVDEWIYLAMGAFSSLALLGLVLSAFRLDWRRDLFSRRGLAVVLIVAHLGGFLVMTLARFGIYGRLDLMQGRFLFPAISSVAMLLGLGWMQLIRKRWVVAAILGGGLLALSIYCLPTYVADAYGQPLPVRSQPPSDADIQLSRVEWERGPTLLGYDLPQVSMRAAGGVLLTLYWEAEEVMDSNYLVHLQVADEEGEVWYRWIGHPAAGRYPTRAWDPGDVVRDEYVLYLPSHAPEGTYRIEVGLGADDDSELLRVVNVDATGNLASLASLIVEAESTWEAAPPNRLEGNSALLGYDLRLHPASIGGHEARFQDTIHLDLYWKVPLLGVREPESEVELRDEKGETWAVSTVPVSISEWEGIGQVGFASHNILVDARTPSGRSRIWARIGEDEISIDAGLRVRNRERRFEVPAMAHTTHYQLDDKVVLCGFDLSSASATTEGAEGGDRYLARLRPGETISLTLCWRALREMSESYTVYTHLLDSSGQMWGQHDKLPLDFYPTLFWASGEVVLDHHAITADPSAPPGTYRLEVGMYSRGSDGRYERLPLRGGGTITLGPIKMLPPGPPVRAAEIPYRLDVRFEDEIRLAGYSLEDAVVAPGESLDLILYWQALEAMGEDYTVFVHLLDRDGRLVAQQDNQPRGGRYSTSSWDEGEMVVDDYRVPLDPDLPAGNYVIEVGMYRQPEATRLRAYSDGIRLEQDRVLLSEITVEAGG